MSDFPKFVEFREEGPREGFQIEKNNHPIEERIELIDMLSDTGLKRIQVAASSILKRCPKWRIRRSCLSASSGCPA